MEKKLNFYFFSLFSVLPTDSPSKKNLRKGSASHLPPCRCATHCRTWCRRGRRRWCWGRSGRRPADQTALLPAPRTVTGTDRVYGWRRRVRPEVKNIRSQTFHQTSQVLSQNIPPFCNVSCIVRRAQFWKDLGDGVPGPLFWCTTGCRQKKPWKLKLGWEHAAIGLRLMKYHLSERDGNGVIGRTWSKAKSNIQKTLPCGSDLLFQPIQAISQHLFRLWSCAIPCWNGRMSCISPRPVHSFMTQRVAEKKPKCAEGGCPITYAGLGGDIWQRSLVQNT